MAPDFQHVPVRTLPSCRTAYPRVSKLFDDPDEGLATIEAIWVAYRILGRETTGLLQDYRWAREFLERNADFAETLSGDS
jgi:pre-rRNA-processing protein TSR3